MNGGRYEAFSTAALINELRTTLPQAKFEKHRLQTGKSIDELVESVIEQVQMVTPGIEPPTSLRDPNDIMVLQAAVGADADLIVTRDKDLRDLRIIGSITVITDEAFCDTLGIPRRR